MILRDERLFTVQLLMGFSGCRDCCDVPIWVRRLIFVQGRCLFRGRCNEAPPRQQWGKE